MVRSATSHRPHRSKLGLVAGMLLLGVAIALVLASGLLVGLHIITALNALLAVFLPGVTLAAAAAGLVWLHRANRHSQPTPAAQVRWNARMAQPRPPLNQRYVGRCPMPARNEVADRWGRS